MKTVNGKPAWDSLVSFVICAVIALIGAITAINWLKTPSFTENKFISSDSSSDTNEAGSQTDTEISQADISSSDVLAEEPEESLHSTQPSETTTTTGATTTTTTVATTEAAQEKEYIKIIVSAAVLRESTSTDSDSLTTIPNGVRLEVLEKSGKWYKVTYREKTGWVHRNCVEAD